MPTTLSNVPLPAEKWVDITDFLGLDVGTPMDVLNIGATDVQITQDDVEPTAEHDAYRIIQRGNSIPFETLPGGPIVWARCRLSDGLLNVALLEGRSSDYWVDIGEGKIPGKSMVGVIGTNTNITEADFKDISDEGTSTGLPSSAETLEIVSDDPEDGPGAGGTGLLALVIFLLDDNYDEEIPILIFTNGLTAVPVPGTHIASNQMIIAASGATLRNVGNINLSVVGTPTTVRLRMLTRRSFTFNGQRTIPRGFFGRVVQLLPAGSKNSDLILRPVLITPAGEATGQDFPIYQAAVVAPLLSPFQIQEMDSFKFQAKRSDAGTSLVSFIAELLLTEL